MASTARNWLWRTLCNCASLPTPQDIDSVIAPLDYYRFHRSAMSTSSVSRSAFHGSHKGVLSSATHAVPPAFNRCEFPASTSRCVRISRFGIRGGRGVRYGGASGDENAPRPPGRFVNPVVQAWKSAPDMSLGVVRGTSLHYHEFDAFRNNRRARMSFTGPPQGVLIVKKPHNKQATRYLEKIALWLHANGRTVFVQDQVYESEVGAQARAAVQPLGDREGEVDLCVTLGGDGTVLFTATLFPSDAPMPPIVSFSMGTLGFLTPFDVRDFRESLSRVMRSYGGKDCTGETLDSSLLKVGSLPDEVCPVNPFESEEEEETAEAEWDIQDDTTSDAGHWDGAEGESEQWGTRRGSARRRVAEETGGNGARLVAAERERAGLRAAGAGKVAEDRDAEDVEQVSSHEILEHMLRPEDGLVERSMPCTLRSRLVCELWHGGELAASSYVLNECVVDRGLAMHTLEIELWVDGVHITNVQADSVILATPSGSTAYSMSAGGPIVSPSVPCILVTPVAPHSLSFRPVVVPDTSVLDLRVPCGARTKPRASFDGRKRIRMPHGSYIRCYTAAFPLCTVNPAPMDHDWYQGITEKLGWNQQIRVHKSPMGSLLASVDVGDKAEDNDERFSLDPR